MELEIVQVDAFTREIFGGNSAAVVVLDEWLENDLMQKIARENNLSETVFVVPQNEKFLIRWFTPTVEVDLCGHATLAAAYVLFKNGLIESNLVNFASNTESLSVAKDGELLQLDFPARPGRRISDLESIENALGVKVLEAFQSRDTLVILQDQKAVETISPDFDKVAALDTFAVIVSAQGEECDFVSRFFAPGAGINEDPVTGSAHCTLVPYWANRLDKTTLLAEQLSERKGELFCEMLGDRVKIAGYCQEYLRGRIVVPV